MFSFEQQIKKKNFCKKQNKTEKAHEGSQKRKPESGTNKN